MKNEVTISIAEIDNGYLVHANKSSDYASVLNSDRAIVGFNKDPETAQALLQFTCEEILFKLMGRTKSFGGDLHAHVNVSVSFTEDPKNPIERV